MCKDMDATMDLDTDIFFLIGPCSDLGHTYGLTEGHIPYFGHFLCHLPPFFPAGGKTIPTISKITTEEMKEPVELVRKNVPLYDQQSSSDYSNVPFISMTAAVCVAYTKEKLATLLP